MKSSSPSSPLSPPQGKSQPRLRGAVELIFSPLRVFLGDSGDDGDDGFVARVPD
jgi:hypothetical protein